MNGMFSSSGAWSRRDFVAATGAAGLMAAGGALAQDAAQRKVKLGIIGCGGRGRWLANLFKKHGGYDIHAVGDYFEDRAAGAAGDHNLPPERVFTGLGCHKKLRETKPDAVAIITPPYFHPQEVADSIDAGAHVYLAKPLAVDVPGCRSIEDSAKRGAANKLCFFADFQTRAMPFYQEAIARVHQGALGDIAFGEAYYHTGRLGVHRGGAGAQESRLRNWVFDKVLSGDIITEQNIHTLDVMSWVFQTPPLNAFGTGGRKSRLDVGDCWDHFALLFQYPNNVGVTFSSRQFEGFGAEEGIVVRVFGSKGVLETNYGGNVMIRGNDDSFYRGGKTQNIYEDGAMNNIATFFDSIVKGDVSNPTLAPSIQSNLITIMARKAAYTGKLVTWEETIKDTEVLEGKLEGLKV
jgi:predicted dehydrogenase